MMKLALSGVFPGRGGFISLKYEEKLKIALAWVAQLVRALRS